jgi:hypothetical protein
VEFGQAVRNSNSRVGRDLEWDSGEQSETDSVGQPGRQVEFGMGLRKSGQPGRQGTSEFGQFQQPGRQFGIRSDSRVGRRRTWNSEMDSVGQAGLGRKWRPEFRQPGRQADLNSEWDFGTDSETVRIRTAG